MRSRVRAPKRKVQWENGAVFARWDTFVMPSVGGTSNYSAQWLRVPAAIYDTVNAREVPSDWTLIREIHTAMFNIYCLGASMELAHIIGMGLIAWDGTDDNPPAVLQTPLPVQQGGLDWIWHWTTPYTQFVQGAGSQVYGQNLDAPESMVFGKTMRKLSAGTGLLFVAEVYCTESVTVNGALWGYSFHARQAFKLP